MSSSSSSSGIGNVFTTQEALAAWDYVTFGVQNTQTALTANVYTTFQQYTTQLSLVEHGITSFIIQTTQQALVAWVINCDSPSYVPPPPTGEITLVATLETPYSSSIVLTWASLIDGLTFDVYRGTAPGNETIIAVDIIAETYTDGPLDFSTTYYYKIVGTNVCGNSTTSNEAHQRTAPTLPTGVQIGGHCMNGFDVQSEVQLRLREGQSTTAQQQGQIYLRHVRRTLDEINRRTFSLYDKAYTDIIANKCEYVMPHRPYELRSVVINDGNGNMFPLSTITAEEADNKYPFWQNVSQPGPLWVGVPICYIDQGTDTFWLLPVPNYNCQAGLIVRGYYGVDKWYTMDMCLPVPEGFDEAVVLGTAWRRCIEMAPQDDNSNGIYAKMQSEYKRDFEEICRRLYRERINRTEATRNQIPSQGKPISYWSTGWYFGS